MDVSVLYFDNIVISSKIAEDHMTFTNVVLIILEEAGVAPRPRSCRILTKRTVYLDLVINLGWLQVANHTTTAVHKLQVPTTVIKLRSVLGLCNTFIIFVSEFCKSFVTSL